MYTNSDEGGGRRVGVGVTSGLRWLSGLSSSSYHDATLPLRDDVAIATITAYYAKTLKCHTQNAKCNLLDVNVRMVTVSY